MTILQSLSWEREPLLDPSHTTYECTRYRGSVIVSYNPGAESFRGNAITLPTPSPGEMPVTTDVAIRRFLEQPRGQLVVTSAGGLTFLKSPPSSGVGVSDGPGLPTHRFCDVRNGPFIRVNSVAEIPGERLWKINLEFETYINEHPNVRGSSYPPLILSNRWFAFDDTNWQHLRTRTYQGTCTVRGDILQAQTGNQKYVDYFRKDFCGFNVPNGFQRESIKVTVTPDGNTAHYTVTDVEQLFSKGRNNPAVRIEVADTAWTSLSGLNRALAAASDSNALGWVVAPVGIAQDLQSIFATRPPAATLLSKMYKNVIVRCWGNRVTPREKLTDYAMAVALTRMGRAGVFDTTLAELLVSGDTNNFVQVNYTIRWGPDAFADLLGSFGSSLVTVALGPLAGPGQTGFQQAISQSPNQTAGGFTYSQKNPVQANPIFPGAASNDTVGVKGTSPLYYLVTQALEQFDDSPAAPDVFTG